MALGADRFAVINHGVPGYSSVEHVVQTAFYDHAFGRRPDCALYYVGWNDLRSAGLPHLDSGYADYHLRSQIDALKVRRISVDFYTPSPLLTMSIRWLSIAVDTARPVAEPAGPMLDNPDTRLEALFDRNIATISAINRGRRIRTLWIGQLLNRTALTGEESADWTTLIRKRDVWPMQARLNPILRERAQALGDVYLDIPVGHFSSQDFADIGHFSAAGSSKFAMHLAPLVQAACRR